MLYHTTFGSDQLLLSRLKFYRQRFTPDYNRRFSVSRCKQFGKIPTVIRLMHTEIPVKKRSIYGQDIMTLYHWLYVHRNMI